MSDLTPQDVPVFNCLVIVSAADHRRLRLSARAAGYAGTNREAAGRVSGKPWPKSSPEFKDSCQPARYAPRGTIPWLKPALTPQAGEQQRIYRVHIFNCLRLKSQISNLNDFETMFR
jgi:hypothetical protein